MGGGLWVSGGGGGGGGVGGEVPRGDLEMADLLTEDKAICLRL